MGLADSAFVFTLELVLMLAKLMVTLVVPACAKGSGASSRSKK
ncbi:hypothetical protein [Helicobacter pylori]|nr:hypothetical protein [Helicobacter pylori]